MPDDPSAKSEPIYLYEQLGGRGGITLIAEKWHERVLADPRLTPLLEGTDPATLQRMQTEFLIQVIVGPAPQASLLPSGADEATAQRLHERILSHLIAALVWANVPRVLIEEVVNVLAPLGPTSLYCCFAAAGA